MAGLIGKIICAWCGKTIGHKLGTDDTHTICRKCKKEQDKLIKELQQ